MFPKNDSLQAVLQAITDCAAEKLKAAGIYFHGDVWGRSPNLLKGSMPRPYKKPANSSLNFRGMLLGRLRAAPDTSGDLASKLKGDNA